MINTAWRLQPEMFFVRIDPRRWSQSFENVTKSPAGVFSPSWKTTVLIRHQRQRNDRVVPVSSLQELPTHLLSYAVAVAWTCENIVLPAT